MNKMRDFSLLIENAAKQIEDEAVNYVFIGVDECFNRSEIRTLVTDLVNKGLARNASALWWEQRLLANGTMQKAATDKLENILFRRTGTL